MKILITILLLLSASFAMAETDDSTEELKQYDVEIIIFEDAHTRYINSESWNRNTAPDDDTVNNTATKVTNNASTFKPIEPHIIKRDYRRINNSSEFNVLLYTAWRQTGMQESEAFEIDIQDLKNSHKVKSKNSISGTLKVVLARYLHFYSQLEYQLMDKENRKVTGKESDGESKETDSAAEMSAYPIQSHRRMRSKELHYIDHPLVGILIQIDPVENKPAEVEAEEIKPSSARLLDIRSTSISPASIKQIAPSEQVNAALFQNVALVHH